MALGVALVHKGHCQALHIQDIETMGRWHDQAGWSTGFISKILKTWADGVIKRDGLPKSQRGLVILDVFAAHRTPDVLEEFQQHGFELVFVPANCTSELQPLDLSLNGPLKEKCKHGFAQWYSQEVCDHIKQRQEEGEEVSTVVSFQPDLRLSVIKPLHCRWLMDAFAEVSSERQLVRQGWESGGIVRILLELANQEDDVDVKCDSHVSENVLSTHNPSHTPVTEFYLEPLHCQSRIDGRSGSHACTVIASLCA